MIDIKVRTIGGPEIARTLAQADSQIRADLRDELATIAEAIVATAQANAPKRTGIMASKISWFFGSEVRRKVKGTDRKYSTTQDTKWKDGRIRMTVRPFGRVAHLMERGVAKTFQQRAGRGSGAGKHVASIKDPKWQEARSLTYERTLTIAPRPFFMPAVAAAGGAEGVNSRLQARLDGIASALGEAA